MPLWRGQPFQTSACTLGLTEDVKVLLLRFTGEICTDYECAHLLQSPPYVLQGPPEPPKRSYSLSIDGQRRQMPARRGALRGLHTPRAAPLRRTSAAGGQSCP